MRAAIVALLVSALALHPVTGYGADQFTNVKLMVNTGDRAEEQQAILRLEDNALVVCSPGGTALKRFEYAAIESMEYSYSKSPRWKSGTAAAVAVGVFAIPIFFMKGKKHWLTVVGNGAFALLRLDKNNYRLIIPALEARSGKQVETVADEK